MTGKACNNYQRAGNEGIYEGLLGIPHMFNALVIITGCLFIVRRTTTLYKGAR